MRVGGCEEKGTHRAPKGRDRENEYWRFCLDHVREYNQSYNFFAGMSDDAVMAYQKDALTGHRPTWKMGNRQGGMRPDARAFGTRGDPFGLFSEGFRAEQQGTRRDRAAGAQCGTQGARHARARDFATPQQVKARFKELVKRHHPDANGGDRSTEDRLVEIIQSYNYLKSVGLLEPGQLAAYRNAAIGSMPFRTRPDSLSFGIRRSCARAGFSPAAALC